MHEQCGTRYCCRSLDYRPLGAVAILNHREPFNPDSRAFQWTADTTASSPSGTARKTGSRKCSANYITPIISMVLRANTAPPTPRQNYISAHNSSGRIHKSPDSFDSIVYFDWRLPVAPVWWEQSRQTRRYGTWTNAFTGSTTQKVMEKKFAIPVATTKE